MEAIPDWMITGLSDSAAIRDDIERFVGALQAYRSAAGGGGGGSGGAKAEL